MMWLLFFIISPISFDIGEIALNEPYKLEYLSSVQLTDITTNCPASISNDNFIPKSNGTHVCNITFQTPSQSISVPIQYSAIGIVEPSFVQKMLGSSTSHTSSSRLYILLSTIIAVLCIAYMKEKYINKY